jgi:hypothetical protein
VTSLEHEADRFADAHVHAGPAANQPDTGLTAAPTAAPTTAAPTTAAPMPPAATAPTPSLSRGAARHVSTDTNPLMTATVTAAVATPHDPVPHGVLQTFSPALRPDLSHARLHRGADAHALARMVGAHAFAHGADIVLGQSASDLHSAASRHVLAHELAHVVQQSPWAGSAAAPRTLFSMKTYVAAMNRKPEPDWATAAEHLNGEPATSIRQVLKHLSRAHRAKLHEAARTWPGLCSNIGQMTEADYLQERGPAAATGERVADACNKPAEPAAGPQAAAPTPPAQAAPIATPGELTQKDADECSPLYQHKLCVYIVGGFNGDRSGVETPDQMAEYNASCRRESGYTGPDVGLSAEDRIALQTPKCPRGDPDTARERAAAARLADAIRRSVKYMPAGAGDQLLALLTDKVFIGSLVAAVGVYLALWAFPEPVFTKLAAAATTIAVLSTGAFTLSAILNLAQAWSDVMTASEAATTDAQIEQAGEQFGKRMGAVTVDLLVFLASLLIGGKLPTPKGLPPAAKALTDARQVLAAAPKGGVVLDTPMGKLLPFEAPSAPRRPASGPRSGASSGPVAGGGSEAVQFYPNAGVMPARPGPRLVHPAPAEPAVPDNLRHLPAPKPRPAPVEPAPAVESPPAANQQTVPVPLAPGAGAGPSPSPQPLPQPQPDPPGQHRPPFVLWLPLQKAPHLQRYRRWLGQLRSDPHYDRGEPGQSGRWHRALRAGGSHAIPMSVYERGHALGLTGARGEARIRVPNWSRTRSVQMQVDHIIELQIAPPAMRSDFNGPDNFELLDSAANASSGNQMRWRIQEERARQVAVDPSLANQVLFFDEVRLDTGMPGERWSIDAIRAGRHLDYYENHHAP